MGEEALLSPAARSGNSRSVRAPRGAPHAVRAVRRCRCEDARRGFPAHPRVVLGEVEGFFRFARAVQDRTNAKSHFLGGILGDLGKSAAGQRAMRGRATGKVTPHRPRTRLKTGLRTHRFLLQIPDSRFRTIGVPALGVPPSGGRHPGIRSPAQPWMGRERAWPMPRREFQVPITDSRRQIADDGLQIPDCEWRRGGRRLQFAFADELRRACARAAA